MAKSRFTQTNFISGVLSPLLRGRTDLTQYYQGVQEAENVVIVPQGGMKRRPGTQYIGKALKKITYNATVPTMPEGGATPSVLVDGDPDTFSTTSNNISTTNPYVVAKTDLGAPLLIEFIDVEGVNLTAGSSDEFYIQVSNDDVTYTNVLQVTLGTTPQNYRGYVGGLYRYMRFARIGSTDLGTAKVAIGTFRMAIQSATLSNVKTLDFSVETDRHYLLVFTEYNCRVYRTPDTHVADIRTNYTSDQVGALRDAQTENVMLLFNEDHAPGRIVNLGTDVDWSFDDIPFVNVPQYDYNDSLSPTPTSDVQVMTLTAFVAGDTFQLDIEGVLSKNITFAGDATADQQSATLFNIQKNIQEMPVMGDTGVTVARTGALQYTITVGGESAKDFELFAGFPTSGTASKSIAFTKSVNGSPRKEDVWSSTRGFPICGCFYEGRLVLGGTKSKRQSLFASKSGNYFDFEIGEGDDDEAIFITISSRKLNNIVDVFAGRNLQIFTDGSEFAVLARPITPGSIDITPQTSHGSLPVEVKDVDGATLFVDRNGKTLRDYVYNFSEDAYTANDKSVLASHIINRPTDMCVLSGTASDDANWVILSNTDGSMVVLNTLRSQDINGFTQWTTSGFISTLSVVGEEMYMINKRTVGGVENNFIERWDFSYRTDCAIKKPVASSVTGLEHLEGETVSVVGDGAVLDSRAVTGGAITMTTAEQAHTTVELGINFVPRIKPMPLNTDMGAGPNGMRIKRIVRMNFRVYQSYGIYVDGIPSAIRSFDDANNSPLNSDPQAFDGIIDDVLDIQGWQRIGAPTITVPDPTSFHLQAIEYEVESS